MNKIDMPFVGIIRHEDVKKSNDFVEASKFLTDHILRTFGIVDFEAVNDAENEIVRVYSHSVN